MIKREINPRKNLLIHSGEVIFLTTFAYTGGPNDHLAVMDNRRYKQRSDASTFFFYIHRVIENKAGERTKLTGH
jgi:hypothetical protein